MIKPVISLVVLALVGFGVWCAFAPEPPLTANKAQPLEAELSGVTAWDRALRDAGPLTPPTRAELDLLEKASVALDANEIDRALGLLDQHRTGYANSALEDDRVGLELLASCMRDHATHRERARTFLLRHPNATILPRLWRACQLGSQ